MTEETADGEHRRAEEEVHGGSPEGAGDGAGAGGAPAPDPIVTTTDAFGNVTVENTGDCTVIWSAPTGHQYLIAARSRAIIPGWVPFPAPPGLYPAPRPPPPLIDEGMKVGEIEAWRAWRVHGGALRSLAMDCIWSPGEPMRGDPGAFPEGVYAFMTKEALRKDVDFACVEDADVIAMARKAGATWINAAYGRVALWGRIVEHDFGYRAEYARVLSLEGGPCGREKLVELCRTYGLPEPPPLPIAKRRWPLWPTVAGAVNVALLAWNITYASIMFAMGRTRLFELGIALAVMSGAAACLCFSRRR